MKRIVSIIYLLFVALAGYGQYLVGLHAVWDDSFREWSVVATADDSTFIEGDLDITWALENDFTAYDFRLGELSGDFNVVFPNNTSNWQLRIGNELVSVRQTWPSDPREWKISLGDKQFSIRARYTDAYDEWQLTNDRYGEFYMYSEVIGDPRDWIIEDFMNDDVPLSMRLAAVFAVMQVISPKQ